MNVIEIKDLCYKYPNHNGLVINDVNLAIRQGDFVTVLGHNGSGKSTLAKLINGLLVPTSGEIKVFGMSTTDKDSIFEIRKNLGLVFQNPDNQTVASIVEDDIAFGPENIGLPRNEIKERIDFALKVTDTESFRHSQISRLSGGQKQRVAIAGVLAVKPKIIILDESTAMLDPKGRREVMDVVKKLNAEGLTVIVITHYLEEAIDSDQIIIMSDGRILKTGTPSEIFNDELTLLQAGLSLPRPKYIANELIKRGIPLKGEILTRESLAKELCELLVKD